MNIFLWILQILLAIHTVMGAIWKFSNAEQAVPSLAMIPHGVWLGLSVIEIICAIALVLPLLKKQFGKFAPMGSAVIALEMIVFTVLHFTSGEADNSPVVYWLVVAAICAFISYARISLKPIK